MEISDTVLAINSGSSSLKFALYQFNATESLLARGHAEKISSPDAHLQITVPSDHLVFNYPAAFPDHAAVVRKIIDELEVHQFPKPAAIGHRLVNGGPDHFEPEWITPAVVAELTALTPLAPLHLPMELKIIAAVSSLAPGTPQIACYDTAFHRSMPAVAQRLPLPRKFWEQGLRRYGFHGLSYEYIVDALGARGKDERLIIAHLGNGASLAAVRDGLSIDTTMGFTPTGGVMMGTRSGDLDPGVLLYLVREKHYDAAMLERLVDRESGLLGVSSLTSDMQALLRQAPGDPNAREALEMFCYLVRKYMGALAAALDGCDGIVFTGGIGENACAIRENICSGLGYLGVEFDSAKNDAGEAVVSTPSSKCVVRVIETNEEVMIARHTYRLMQESKDKP